MIYKALNYYTVPLLKVYKAFETYKQLASLHSQ